MTTSMPTLTPFTGRLSAAQGSSVRPQPPALLDDVSSSAEYGMTMPQSTNSIPPQYSANRLSRASRRRALLGRLAARQTQTARPGYDNGPIVEPNECPNEAPTSRRQDLRRRIQGLQESRPVWQRTGSRSNPTPTNDRDVTVVHHDIESGSTPSRLRNDGLVVLNFQNIDKDWGVRPVGGNSDDAVSPADGSPADRLSSGHTRLTADEKGQLRYFGYSSLLRMVSILPPSSPSSSDASEPIVTRPCAEVEALADSATTQLYLIDLFFQYQHAAHPVLEEQDFRESYARGESSEYFSSFLLNSILLQALKFANIPQSEQLRRVYVRRARDNLVHEIENPSIATIPALCLFGSYLAGEGSDRACWVYPGLAFRLLYDFGLHEDCVNIVEAGLLSDRDRRVRHSILYHCFVFDTLYSSFQGRPKTVRLEGFSCPMPSAESLGPSYKLTLTWVRLASILEDILAVINGKEETIYQDASIQKLSEASDRLLQWFKTLPAELRWTPNSTHSPSPATCAIHLQFLSTTILLNRPFAAYMQKSSRRKGALGSDGKKCLHGQTPEISQRLCTTSGVRVSKLLLAYRLHHGPAKFFSTINPACLSASMALISDIVSAGPMDQKHEEKKWLTCILETLKAITPTYPVAGRSYMTLCAVTNACGLAGLIPASDRQQQAPLGGGQLDEQLQMGNFQGNPDELFWNIDGALGWEFYPTLDVNDVHGIGLTDFCPRLSPWPLFPNAGNSAEGQ
ncbi:hypothetical protein B0J13DRAFT_69884 [Dactylonectria estremocensis]|uniref:Xylanolytic transcriptional activator regulatory domain-containing protein n=1 Tax=Dactylonectria estremocensis TaxID=1079267 RepID=A0A9P9J1N7_9HYPO|nr:hypothetical protein B0J13DRAFT_69884 [Dactylonectria estremocensis]